MINETNHWLSYLTQKLIFGLNNLMIEFLLEKNFSYPRNDLTQKKNLKL